MKVLVTGVKGQLGHDVMNELAKRGYEGVGVDVEEMDITDEAAVRRVMEEVRPDKNGALCSLDSCGCSRGSGGNVPQSQRSGNRKYCKNVRGAGYSHDLPQYRLCV